MIILQYISNLIQSMQGSFIIDIKLGRPFAKKPIPLEVEKVKETSFEFLKKFTIFSKMYFHSDSTKLRD